MITSESVLSIAAIFAALGALSLLETLIPLRRRPAERGARIAPNLILTALTLVLSLALNWPFALGLIWLEDTGWGLFNALHAPPWIAALGAIVALDLTQYVTHRSMHAWTPLWRFHAIHHSDVFVDATTAIRQHPGEGLIRYAYMAACAFAIGASPVAFVAYRALSALHGVIEHANIKLPIWLER